MKQKYRGLMSAFVMIMFGLIAVCYLMGFTNAWSAYTTQTPDEDADLVDLDNPSEFGVDFSIGQMMINGIRGLFESAEDNPVLAWVGTIATVVGAIVVAKAGGAQAFAYIIPIVLVTIFANIFIFPIAPISGEMSWVADTVPVDAILIVFFNLFMFLAIIDFISGGRT